MANLARAGGGGRSALMHHKPALAVNANAAGRTRIAGHTTIRGRPPRRANPTHPPVIPNEAKGVSKVSHNAWRKGRR
jgi:hypothetical protein